MTTDNSLFFHVAQLHAELREVNNALTTTGQAIVSSESMLNNTVTSATEWPSESDLAHHVVDMKDHENTLLEKREAIIHELWPSYLRLVDEETHRLEDVFDSPEALAEECFMALSTVVRAYAFRLRGDLQFWNDIVDPLIQLSEGLPVESEADDDTEATLVRTGPDGTCSGVRTRNREFTFRDAQAAEDTFFSVLSRNLMNLLAEEHHGGSATARSAPSRLVWYRSR